MFIHHTIFSRRTVLEMLQYHGIVLDKSIRDESMIKRFKILGSRHSSTNPWIMYLVEVDAGNLDHETRVLQKNMKPRFYAHFYRDSELRVVFPDKIFIANVNDKGSWHAFQDYGLKLGIPKEQLECKPVKIEEEKDWLG